MRAVVNVSTGRYCMGQQRLKDMVGSQCQFIGWSNSKPEGSPSHDENPYAFKAWALKTAIDNGFTTLIWADACIVPVRPLAGLFETIERDGYWISRNGFANAEWTAPESYAALGVTPAENENIEHVVATTFGINFTHPIGRRIFEEYFRLANSGAFRGPWRYLSGTRASRGDKNVSGHRHDQTALSVIAHRCGCVLTDPPKVFSYRGGETPDTFLVADGAY